MVLFLLDFEGSNNSVFELVATQNMILWMILLARFADLIKGSLYQDFREVMNGGLDMIAIL